jgi:cellulose synthase/poly-beta-1,6-N-acetylglucosamine synthase-like glycosyltransferase
MNVKIYSFFLAVSLTLIIGFNMPSIIDQFNDDAFSSITILDRPALLGALTEVQSRGMQMGIHGWRHENYSAITPLQAERAVNNGLAVFREAGLIPVAFLDPYMSLLTASAAVKEAINGTGIGIHSTFQEIGDSGLREYGRSWRTMENSSDPRFSLEQQRILSEKPTAILLHVQDWNPHLKSLVCNYLQRTNKTNIFIRIDDIEVNTPPEKIYDMAVLLQYPAVDRVILGVIPAGNMQGEDVDFFGLNASSIFKAYWWFYMIFAFLPIVFFVSWRLIASRKRETGAWPMPRSQNLDSMSVSIIIPAYNEEQHIAGCLEAVGCQDFKGKMDTIVVDDGSTDSTGEIASRYPVTVVRLKKNLGKANALNIGIKKSKGDIIIFSDSDSQLSSNAVSLLVKCLEEHPDAHAVAGNILIDNCAGRGKKNLLIYFQMIEYRIEQTINRFLQSLGGRVMVCPGPIFAVRRQVTDMLKFSDQTIVEDADFTIHALKNNMKVVQEPLAMAYTWAPETFHKWFLQRKRWWYGNLQLWDMHNGWAKKNPWMLLNYFGFLNSIISVMLLLIIPLLLMNFQNSGLVLLRSIAYIIVPLMMSCLIMAPFFINDKKLLPMLLPYFLIYSTTKMFVVSYLYVRYLSGRGIDISFGPRVLRVR